MGRRGGRETMRVERRARRQSRSRRHGERRRRPGPQELVMVGRLHNSSGCYVKGGGTGTLEKQWERSILQFGLRWVMWRLKGRHRRRCLWRL